MSSARASSPREQLRIDVLAPSTPVLEVEYDGGFVTVALMNPAGTRFAAVVEPMKA